MGYDATMQGSIFSKTDHEQSLQITGTPKRTILSNQVGLSYAGTRWIFDATATFNTKEVKSQIYNTHQWGSVTIIYRFSGDKGGN